MISRPEYSISTPEIFPEVFQGIIIPSTQGTLAFQELDEQMYLVHRMKDQKIRYVVPVTMDMMYGLEATILANEYWLSYLNGGRLPTTPRFEEWLKRVPENIYGPWMCYNRFIMDEDSKVIADLYHPHLAECSGLEIENTLTMWYEHWFAHYRQQLQECVA